MSVQTALEDRDQVLGTNEACTLSHSPADTSKYLPRLTPAHGIKDTTTTQNPNQGIPTIMNEHTGSVGQEPTVWGGAYGASPPGTEGTPCTKEMDIGSYFLIHARQLSVRRSGQKGLV